MSARSSVCGSAVACSGAMYDGVPSAKPTEVSATARARFRHRLRHAEIGDLRVPAREQHVVGLDVAVHDAMLVRVLQRFRHFAEESRRLGQRQLARALEPRAERFALDERHRVPEQLARESGVEEGNDVGMLQPRHHLHLAAEAILVDGSPPSRAEAP